MENLAFKSEMYFYIGKYENEKNRLFEMKVGTNGTFEIKEILKENDPFNTLWIDGDFVNENGNFKANGARLVKDELGNSAKILDTQILVLPNDLKVISQKTMGQNNDISGDMMIKVCQNLINKSDSKSAQKVQKFINLKQILDKNQSYKVKNIKEFLKNLAFTKNEKSALNQE